MDNPFAFQSPEVINSRDIVDLYVDVFSDTEKVKEPYHTMINGPRGSGKSMMLRYLMPDCQALSTKRQFKQLDFWGIYFPVKSLGSDISELGRFKGQLFDRVFNEHILCVNILEYTFGQAYISKIIESGFGKNKQRRQALLRFINHSLVDVINFYSYDKSQQQAKSISCFNDLIENIHLIISNLRGEVYNVVRRALDWPSVASIYKGPLLSYDDFLKPFLVDFKDRILGLAGKPIYLMIDDADYLNECQTQILNGWISERNYNDICIKVATQFRYKTMCTPSLIPISSPHDYSEVNISTIYTKSVYYNNVNSIIKKRLHMVGIDVEPADFFPEDKDQLLAINSRRQELILNWHEGKGRGARADDDAYRYARPDYIKSLGGKKKGTHNYSYSGFDQLVDLSSGVIRDFLEPASCMYKDVLAQVDGKVNLIKFIPPSKQDENERSYASNFIKKISNQVNSLNSAQVNEGIDLKSDPKDFSSNEGSDKDGYLTNLSTDGSNTKYKRLFNLVSSLGGIFQLILKSDRSERRVFSVAFSDDVEQDIVEVFELGVQEMFFHKSTIGNKEGNGRVQLYVLTRKIAPYFNLDPTSFSGYLFITSGDLASAINEPKSFIYQFNHRRILNDNNPNQLNLFTMDF